MEFICDLEEVFSIAVGFGGIDVDLDRCVVVGAMACAIGVLLVGVIDGSIGCELVEVMAGSSFDRCRFESAVKFLSGKKDYSSNSYRVDFDPWEYAV